MKLEQDQVFKPITITLETEEEAITFWNMMELVARIQEMPAEERTAEERQMAEQILEFFYGPAHL